MRCRRVALPPKSAVAPPPARRTDVSLSRLGLALHSYHAAAVLGRRVAPLCRAYSITSRRRIASLPSRAAVLYCRCIAPMSVAPTPC